MPWSRIDLTSLPPPKLLLVDDVAANLTALSAIFEPLRCELVLASSGDAALRAVLEHDFAAILLDVQMPGLDGFETAALIRGRPRSRHVPIIFLTAVSKERDMIFRGYERGAVDYLVKPFHPDILRSKVSVFLELRQLREAVRVAGEETLRSERATLVQKSAHRYQQLVDGMSQCVWRTDADGEVELVNRVWREYTGLSSEQSRGSGWHVALHPDDRAPVLERRRAAVETRDSFEAEVRLRRADGEYRWFLVRVVPELDDGGRVVARIGTATDIDDHRRNREALAAALEAKDEFLAAASHELRTPLAAAKAQVQLSLRRIDQHGASDRLVRSLQVVRAQVDRMTRLVEDLLDVNRLRTGRLSLQLEEYDLIERIRAEVERLRALSPAHELAIDAPDTLAIVADRDRIDQVLINLLTNAIRYSPDGGPVLVRVRPTDDGVQVAVIDRGVGVPPDKQETIFERFGRAHGARYGGLGLGLNIAQGIVEQHGGRIWVQSTGRSGEGSAFFFEIPTGMGAGAERESVA